MPTFEEFSRQDSRSSNEPMFTLQRRGLISFNQAAFKALGEPSTVVLLYDADEGIVGLHRVARSHANGYAVRKQANSQSYLVPATGFAAHYKIPTDIPRRFVGHEYGSQTWGFDLSEGVEVKSRSRSKGTSSDESS